MKRTIAVFAGLQVAVWVAAPALLLWGLMFYGSHPLIQGATLLVLGSFGAGLATVAAVRTFHFVDRLGQDKRAL